ETYNFVQNYINTGFVEAGAHSRTHPGYGAWENYDSEITGNKNDIISNLDMPALYRNGEHEYVYTWIAPHGYVDEIIDSLIGQNKILVNRLYHDDFIDDFSEWNPESGSYYPFTVTRAFDPPRSVLGWGIGTNDIDNLNGKFDEVLENGGVYHLMCHPNVMEWDKGYPWYHLDHISNRGNVWYVGLGHLYLYHLAQENYIYQSVVNVAQNDDVPSNIRLHQNYPNPFNPVTTIEYSIPTRVNSEKSIVNSVKLEVFDILGQKVASLVDGKQRPGNYEVNFNAENLNSGVYLYRLRVNDNTKLKKMIYLK
ncbi:MAG: T9SS type A sorting domain-containing protein, partial [Melioribacteraceae bacterium]|nr:T9SS type A sorting domain-containing protein [Melioribacteraceae bacterium]